jgi:hypothetical protein
MEEVDGSNPSRSTNFTFRKSERSCKPPPECYVIEFIVELLFFAAKACDWADFCCSEEW